MKKIIVLLVCMIFSLGIKAQTVIGAWERNHTSENGEKLKSVVIFSDGYQVLSTYKALTGEFITTNGGTWKLSGSTMTEKVEFSSTNPERVGTEVSFEVSVNDSILSLVKNGINFKRIDAGTPGKLMGSWQCLEE